MHFTEEMIDKMYFGRMCDFVDILVSQMSVATSQQEKKGSFAELAALP